MTKIKNIGWSIGNYCNAKCRHCYSWKKRKNSNDYLSQSELDLIIDKLIDYRIETVNFGGNEPIFTQGKAAEKSTLPYIIRRLTEAGIICGITTNGFTAHYLHQNHYDAFMAINDWDFSLDSPIRELHNQNRNVRNAFEEVIRGIELCIKNDRPRSIVVAGMNWNIDPDNLAKFLELATRLDAELRINLLKPVEKHHFQLLPDIYQVYNAFNYLFENTDLITLSEPILAVQAGIAAQGCHCGIDSFRIQSKINGRVPVTPCIYVDLDGGDLLTSSIDEIVNSDVFKRFNQRSEIYPSKCRQINCPVIDQCKGGCTARALLFTGEYDAPDPYCPYFATDTSAFNLHRPQKTEEDHGEKIRVHENYLCTWIGSPKKK